MEKNGTDFQHHSSYRVSDGMYDSWSQTSKGSFQTNIHLMIQTGLRKFLNIWMISTWKNLLDMYVYGLQIWSGYRGRQLKLLFPLQVNLSQCDYLVDLSDPERVTPLEPNYAAETKEWKKLSEYPFLNAAKSHPFFRAFYIPFLSSKYTEYNSYVLLDRIRKVTKVPRKGGKEFHDDDDIDDL